MQITLGGDQRAMTGDLAEHVNRNACVGHPGQAGVAQVVTTKVLVTEGGYHLVPLEVGTAEVVAGKEAV